MKQGMEDPGQDRMETNGWYRKRLDGRSEESRCLGLLEKGMTEGYSDSSSKPKLILFSIVANKKRKPTRGTQAISVRVRVRKRVLSCLTSPPLLIAITVLFLLGFTLIHRCLHINNTTESPFLRQ